MNNRGESSLQDISQPNDDHSNDVPKVNNDQVKLFVVTTIILRSCLPANGD